MSKVEMSMTGIKNIFEERKKKSIKPIKCVCSKCLYYNRKRCRFGKTTANRNYCIKFIKSKGYNDTIKFKDKKNKKK